MESLPTGPDEKQQNTGYVKYFAKIENATRSMTAILTTPEAYKTTYLATLEVIEKLKNYLQPGFQTPYSLLGAEVLDNIPGFTLNFNNERYES